MSTDYTMHVKRCCDNKEIAKFICNEVKCIMDSEFAEQFGCPDSYYRTSNLSKKITTDLLCNIKTASRNKIYSTIDKIIEKKLMIPYCKNVDVKKDLENDIVDLKEYIEDMQYVIDSCSEIIGKITLVTEDLFKKNKLAYEYNGNDLPKKKITDSFGTRDEDVCIFNDSVYATLTEC